MTFSKFHNFRHSRRDDGVEVGDRWAAIVVAVVAVIVIADTVRGWL